MVRPKKDESLRKGKQISIRFSEAEYAKITELTKQIISVIAVCMERWRRLFRSSPIRRK